MWLGRLRQAQRHWQEAIAAFRAIPANETHFDAAMQAIVQCYDQWQAEKKAAGEDVRPVARAATACYRQLLSGLQPPDGHAGRVCALALAKALLQQGDSGCGEAQQALTAALAGSSPPPDNWQAEARGLLVLALVGQGKMTAAQAALEQISAGPDSTLVTLVERLAQRAHRLPAGPNRRAAAALAIHAAEIVPAAGRDLPADLARRFRTAQATALAAAGRRRAATRSYTLLAGKDPKDAEVQQALAQLLGQSKDPRELERALATWQTVQRLSPVASPRWFRARYGPVSYTHLTLPTN